MDEPSDMSPVQAECLKNGIEDAGNVINCFICDENFEDTGCVPLSIGFTSYSHTRLPTKIGQLMGDDIMIVIARDDVLCQRCTALLNHLDKLEEDMGIVQNALRGYLNKKYKLLDLEEENGFTTDEVKTMNVEANLDEGLSQVLNMSRAEPIDQPLHECSTCDYKSPFPGMMKSHQARCRSRQLWYRCSMCDKKFPSEKHARKHIMAAHLSNWPCHYCGANFSEESEYTSHMKTHMSSMTSSPQSNLPVNSNNTENCYCCSMCSFQTNKSSLLEDHRNAHTTNILTCNECHENFENVDDYDIHLTSHKSVESSESFQCSLCGSTFPSHDDLQKHLENHQFLEPVESFKEEEETCDAPVALSLDDLAACIVPAGEELTSNISVLPNSLNNIEYHFCALCSVTFEDKTSFEEHNKLHSDDQHLPLDKVVSECNYIDIDGPLEEMLEKITCEKKNKSGKNISEVVADDSLDVCLVPDVEKSDYQFSENCDNSEQEPLFLLSSSDLIGEQQTDNTKVSSPKLSNSSKIPSLEDNSDLSNNSTGENNEESDNDVSLDSIFELVRMKKLSSIKLDTTEMPLLLGTLGKYPITSSVDLEFPNIDTTAKPSDITPENPAENTIYECIICLYQTADTADLHSHMKLHENKEKDEVLCSVCNKGFLNNVELETHLQKHQQSADGTIQTCRYCLKIYDDKSQLQQHMQEAHPRDKQLHLCMYCCKVFPSKKSLKSHEETHAERINSIKFVCELCNQSFHREKQLKDHTSLIHRDPHCRFCGKEIHKAKTLKFHEMRHLKNKISYDCVICSRKFKTRTGLTHHKATHTGEYKYRCSFCDHGFMSRMMMEEHKSKHTKEERYICDICGKKFSFQSTYWIHRKWHDNPYPYKCNYCDRMFRHSSLLAVHKRKHTGERPYKCMHCPMSFTVGGTLKRHMILHTGKYPYSCDECKRGFTTKHKYATHMAKTHGDIDLLQAQGQSCQYKVVIPESATSILEPTIELVDWEPDDDDPTREFVMEIENTGPDTRDDCSEIALPGTEEMVPCTIIGDSVLVNEMAQRVVEIVMDDTSQNGAGVSLGDDNSMLSADLWSYQ